MRKQYMKPKPIRKTIKTFFFSVGRIIEVTTRVVGIILNFNFLWVIIFGISEFCVANIVLQKHFLPDPSLIDKGITFLAQNTSQKQQNMFKSSPIV